MNEREPKSFGDLFTLVLQNLSNSAEFISDDDSKNILNLLIDYLTSGVPLSDYISSLKSKYPCFRRCQRVLEKGSVIYRCQTFAFVKIVLNMAITALNHLVTSENCYGGGICDCGDSNNLKESGWCSIHRNSPIVDNADLLLKGE
ncbi:hypothetical protein JH06_1176 [Blastocystis sp. subtype 4]|uniref:hypothetical protein n=1 Tax=Blastocystis sp. subtype 4 TaxID=944170 RepID=UPI0007112A6D|nr:hypothetical protein JH06_1176 [Blastocystis sp. subtype 4]KNB45602.1 hypothetical protein JH06_1176 [Blastocystis sp. subtype 4]|eukprot:XP_014529045.1 hypothetical protein JH06_1176 [Blastocystis sp. subtype 4]